MRPICSSRTPGNNRFVVYERMISFYEVLAVFDFFRLAFLVDAASSPLASAFLLPVTSSVFVTAILFFLLCAAGAWTSCAIWRHIACRDVEALNRSFPASFDVRTIQVAGIQIFDKSSGFDKHRFDWRTARRASFKMSLSCAAVSVVSSQAFEMMS